MNHFNSQRPARNQREKVYVLEMLDLILLLNIGFPSYVARVRVFGFGYKLITRNIKIPLLPRDVVV